MGWIGKKGRQKRTGDIEILANALAAGDIPVSGGICLKLAYHQFEYR